MVFFYRFHARQEKIFTDMKRVETENLSNKKHKLLLLSFSHELRNLISGLIGQLTLITENSLSAENRSLVEGARRSGDMLVHQINNILDSGKVDIEELEVVN